ncbi:exocyst complex component, putative [Entamoeba histolytica HM-3:IMSS]|uniref:Sec6 protein, putative n=6 Tax=Entamoeba histolytica TaxID=5759 RepID=C4M5A1_ENTH1|nr:Sec6 protein, putative [Entamoeba histolytica HM-1:IMSS]EMD42460.1 exocyst complex component, putative [Entamoeba histolytica KU27]EMS11242.1 exocyst complex component, putative [Entamoeba histolytica HM-3:IMSS]ENY60846.1 exocyst complex component, putative [Entamoeba histolytica HM-1:IMSS-A]GAT96614.1 sec6 protein putative [Entamoeba histolytica]EAL51418.1 Sec6 protein, putative [Entamoeba histolytica HM-1:IMSS]|eukprot:XP_656804.1 Sec6 protein, putative [Entamoeba histolytica HM-1:IMSS]
MISTSLVKTFVLAKQEEKKLTMEEEAEQRAINEIERLFGSDKSTGTINEREIEALEKSESLDARLKTRIQEELEGFSIGLKLLEKSQENATEIDKLSLEIADICQACDDLFQNYALVKEITTIKRNLKEVIETVKYLKCLKDKVKEVEELLKDEQNLLRVHSIVRTYEMLRLAIEKQIRKFGLPYTADVDPYFQQITQIRQLLTQSIDDIFEEFIERANKRPEILVKIAVITERDRRDRELIKQQSKVENSKIQQYEYDGVDYIQKIQGLVKTAAEKSIYKKFEIADQPWINTSPTMKSLQDYLDELTIASFDADACFPPEYQIKNIYLMSTTTKLYDLFKLWSNSDPDKLGGTVIANTTIISLLKWVTDDFLPTMTRIGVPSDSVPNFYEALRGAQLQYRERIRGKMFEWVPNIAKEDVKQTPSTINNLLYTTAPVDLFGIVKEQIEIAKTSKNSDFIYEVVNALVTPLELYSTVVSKQLKDSLTYNRLTEEQQEETEDVSLPLGYVISIINNSNACIEKTEDMLSKVTEIIGTELADKFDFSTVIGSFDRLIDEACIYIRETIMDDCEVKIKDLFEDEYYGDDDCIEMIAGCIQEYASSDLQPNLLKIYVEDIVDKCVVDLINKYITQLITKKHKFNRKDRTNTGDMIAKDSETINSFLQDFVNKKKLMGHLNVLRGFSQLLKEEADSVRSGYNIILQDYKDCPVEIVRFLISERDDFGSSDKDTAYEGLQNVYDQLNVDFSRIKPTIFSTLQIPSKLNFIKPK